MIQVANFTVKKASRTICDVREFSVSLNECVTIVGPNGCGKSTLLRVLAGIDEDYSGKCDVDTPMVRRCYVHQRPYLFRGSVLANVAYGLRARGMSSNEATAIATQSLKSLDMYAMRSDSVAHLSGGERRRVAIARALVLQPQLLLLDEPFAELDSNGVSAVCAAIQDLDNCTTVIASPRQPSVALSSKIVQPFSTLFAERR